MQRCDPLAVAIAVASCATLLPLSVVCLVFDSCPSPYQTNRFARQAKALQASLMQIVDRVEVVKNEHEKLEGGNKFLQSYVVTPHSSMWRVTNRFADILAS
jgi:hypothetical protein